jgi:hypothetical protein
MDADYLKSKGWTSKRIDGHVLYTSYQHRTPVSKEEAITIQQNLDAQREQSRKIEEEARKARKEAEAQRLQNEKAVKVFHSWRDMPEQTIDVMEDFSDFVAEHETLLDSEIDLVKKVIAKFMGNMEQVKQGELALLVRWKESNK